MYRSPYWALSSLWKPDVRCKVNIPDLALFQHGVLQSWIFTSKSGDVVKKRSTDIGVLREKLVKLAIRNPLNTDRFVCNLRYKDASEVVNIENFSSKLASLESVVCLQAYIRAKGGTDSSYRNDYSLVNDKGRYISSTFKRVNFGGGEIRSTASHLNDVMDKTTQTVVRFIEINQHVRVLKISVEYIVDEDDQPWLVWISNLVTATGAAASDLSLAGLPGDSGRLINSAGYKQKRSRSSRGSRRPKSRSRSPPSRREQMSMNEDGVVMGLQVGSASGQLELHGEPSSPTGDMPLSSTGSRNKDVSRFTFGIARSNQKRSGTGYPNPFSCHGDFCNFAVHDPQGLGDTKKETALEMAKRLFSEDELKELAGKVDMQVLAPGDAHENTTKQQKYYVLTYKSIALARKERRGIAKVHGSSRLAESPKSSSSRTRSRNRFGKRHSDDSTNLWDEEVVAGGLSNYYREVKVCPNCYKVYTTLNRARETLQDEQNPVSRGRSRRTGSRDGLIARLMQKSKGKVREQSPPEPSGRLRTRTPSPVRAARRYMGNSASTPILPQTSPGTKDGSSNLRQRSAHQKSTSSTRGKLEENTSRNSVSERQARNWKGKNSAKRVGFSRSESRAMNEKPGMQNFEDLDGFLRGTSKGNASRSPQGGEGRESPPLPTPNSESFPSRSRSSLLQSAGTEYGQGNTYSARILIAEPDRQTLAHVKNVLESEGYVCALAGDGSQVIQMTRDSRFDLLLLARDLPSMSGIEVTKVIRRNEREQDPPGRRLPIIVFTTATASEDLRLYQEVGMDGCVSKPVDESSLLNTISAGVPQHQPPATRMRVSPTPKSRGKMMVGNNTRPLRPKTTGLVNSSSIAKLSLPVPMAGGVDEAVPQIFQMDADTSLSYVVLGKRRQGSTFFNFVVVHDFFDTFETMQIFFKPLVSKYPGLQVLLFNTPGQAFTEWREDAVLNNSYLSECLGGLLKHVDYNGTGEFHTGGAYALPYYLMGFGNGANVALYHSIKNKNRNMRAVLAINGFSHLDPSLASVLHDCMNLFSCSPSTRPDLPVYFYTRFLFSPAHLHAASQAYLCTFVGCTRLLPFPCVDFGKRHAQPFPSNFSGQVYTPRVLFSFAEVSPCLF